MSNMILFSGQSLQRKYEKCGGGVKGAKELARDKADKDALRASRKKQTWRTKALEERMDQRDDNRKSLDELIKEEIARIPNKENMKIADIERQAKATVQSRIAEAKKNTNRLAREHNLEQPNNPEAVEQDRYHCYVCDGHLHIPDAYKTLDDDVSKLFDDTSVKHLCCFCFAKMDDGELSINKGEATAEIRLAVYNPEESVNKDVDTKHKIQEVKKMSDLEKIRLKSKMKKYQHVINMVGNVKHDYLQEGDDIENCVRNGAKTRYNACTL